MHIIKCTSSTINDVHIQSNSLYSVKFYTVRLLSVAVEVCLLIVRAAASSGGLFMDDCGVCFVLTGITK